MRHVFIVAVESSSEQLGAGLIQALKAIDNTLQISGVGGPSMAAQGVKSGVDITGLGILGFTEAIKMYPLVLRRVNETVANILDCNPDAVVLIDSWGFMIRVSQRLKRAGYKGKIIKYVAPQVWAMREGRAKLLAGSTDHLLSIHSFDAPYFETHGLPVTHVGNPMFDTDYNLGDAAALRRDLRADTGTQTCALFFGSRVSEFNQLKAPILDAVSQLLSRYPALKFVSPISAALWDHVHEDLKDMPKITLLKEERKYDVFAGADVAIACSGTITTQLASAGVPCVVAYRLKPLTWRAAKWLYKPDYISLVNISAGKPLMAECLQNEAAGENFAREVSLFLDDEALRIARAQELKVQAQVMKGKGGSASECAAQKIIELLAS